jgi:hypothetical protein
MTKLLNFKNTATLSFLSLMLGITSCQTTTDTEDFDCTTVDNTVASIWRSCDNDHTADAFTSTYSESVSGGVRSITSNNIPNHDYGVPVISMAEIVKTYTMPSSPALTGTTKSVFGTSRIDYTFGIGVNGVKLDPAANFPYENPNTGEQNFEWVLEALNNSGVNIGFVNINLDCNQAHLQATGAYHYHGDFPDFAAAISVGAVGSDMLLVGWAADGYPIYYKYAYNDATDASSGVSEMKTGFQIKAGERPGDGLSAPCGTYNGKYEQDYEHVSGLGDLDECNGRTGVTPEFPGGTYYYVVTASYPAIPRCFKGTPDNSFRI